MHKYWLVRVFVVLCCVVVHLHVHRDVGSLRPLPLLKRRVSDDSNRYIAWNIQTCTFLVFAPYIFSWYSSNNKKYIKSKTQFFVSNNSRESERKFPYNSDCMEEGKQKYPRRLTDHARLRDDHSFQPGKI